MADFLTFRKMLMPIIIQVVFWLGMLAVVFAGLVEMTDNFLAGVFVIVFGTLLVRIYAELLIVTFTINDRLNEINESLMEIKDNTKIKISDTLRPSASKQPHF